MRTHFLPHLNRTIVFVDRNQLRLQVPTRCLTISHYLRGLTAEPVPTPPTFINWQQVGSRKLSYPILGNDKAGDCWYAACAHGSQTFTGNNGVEASFDVNTLLARYRVLSGGDNGLDDSTMLGEWKGGIIGPNGPYKILDRMAINPSDIVGIKTGIYLYGGAAYTAALPDSWVANPQPGDTWDVAAPNENNGHAMWLTGVNNKGGLDDQTWGFDPPINLTFPGMQHSDPEIIVVFSLDWFNNQGMAPNGYSYAQLANWWVQMGGNPLPPFTPTPGPTPTPSPAKLFTVRMDKPTPKGGMILIRNLPVAVPIGKYDWVPQTPAHEPLVVEGEVFNGPVTII